MAEHVIQIATRQAPDLGEYSEDDLACRFIAEHPRLRYVAAWNRWMVYHEGRWIEDATLDVFDRIRAMLRSLATEKTRKQLLAAKTVYAVERLARSDQRAAATIDQWDADDWLICTPSGITALRTGAERAHDPLAYMTKQVTSAPNGDCPRWLQFLDEITEGNQALIDFLQRVAGYAATGDTSEHALFFLYGTGANGKGTFLNTLVKALGDYAAIAPMEVFTDSYGDRHPTELAMLRMIRLVVSQETEQGRRWAESRIKALTGGDPVSARFMRQDFFTYTPRFKLLIAGNHKPALRNVDEAIRRRLHLLPFTVTIPRERRDPDLTAKLEAELPGITRWIIEGARRYAEQRLAPPAIVTAATDEYFQDEDLFQQWLEDACERAPGAWEKPTPLYRSWSAYAEAAGERAGSQKAFGARLRTAGFEPGKSSAMQGRHWSGLKLRPTPELEPIEGTW